MPGVPAIGTGGTLRGAATGARSGERRAGLPAAFACVTGPGRGDGGLATAAAGGVVVVGAGTGTGALEDEAERGEAGAGVRPF